MMWSAIRELKDWKLIHVQRFMIDILCDVVRFRARKLKGWEKKEENLDWFMSCRDLFYGLIIHIKWSIYRHLLTYLCWFDWFVSFTIHLAVNKSEFVGKVGRKTDHLWILCCLTGAFSCLLSSSWGNIVVYRILNHLK